MADNISKSVAARVPMDTYIEIIRAAAELKMTVSDYLIMKLFQESKNEQLQQDLAEKEKAISQIKSELAEIQKEKKKLETVKADSAIGSKEKDTKVKEQATKITSLATENTSLKAEVARLKAGNTTTNTTLNTTLNTTKQYAMELEDKLKAAQSELRSIQASKKLVDSKVASLQTEVKQMETTIKTNRTSSLKAYEELVAFDKRNSNFLGAAIGEEFTQKIKKILQV